MQQPNPVRNAIIVTGDVVIDHHLYAGERSALTMLDRRGMRPVRKLGGAAGLAKLIEAVLHIDGDVRWFTELGITTPDINAVSAPHHAFAVWRPMKQHQDSKVTDLLVWRAEPSMGYGHLDALPGEIAAVPCDSQPEPLPALPNATILVLDDGGAGFRADANRACWLLPDDPAWILLKTSHPVAQGDLWQALVPKYADRLVCLVSAHDLRCELADISKGLSWERSIEDLCRNLRYNAVLHPLMACRHLVVTFSGDAALWLDNSAPAGPRAVLCFDAARAEGEWAAEREGHAIGYLTGMAAALVRALAQRVPATGPIDRGADLRLAPAIEAGLMAMRDLKDLGHGSLDAHNLPNGYPVDRIAKVIREPKHEFSRMTIPWPTPALAPGTWTMAHSAQRLIGCSIPPSVIGLATQVAVQGDAALQRLPHARFGDLVTADRQEIETLRRIRELMRLYAKDTTADKPLSIGVFGPPGAGKSFGVKQLAIEVFKEKAWLEFNLSQFTPPHDLMGALQQVRDRVLRGITPVVLWDEFDAREYEWLQYVLAPMQDGRFQDGQLNYTVGKCVFVFAGGTSSTFDIFGRKPGPGAPKSAMRAYREFVLRKGPDFKSRIDIYYNVLGPNQRLKLNPTVWSGDDRALDPTDIGYPLRRALLLRGLLKCKFDERLDFDPDLLEALLRARYYEHGTRSFEKLVQRLRTPGTSTVRRSSLPPPQQIGMHTDADEFAELINQQVGFRIPGDMAKLAPAIHQTWRELSQKEGWSMGVRYDRPFEKLAPIDQQDNEAAAKRIPEILALAGLGVVPPAATKLALAPTDKEVRAHLEHHIERLAEAEHIGWMTFRKWAGWRHDDKRDDDKLMHPAVVPYKELSERDKEKDRNSVRHFPDMIARANYRIVWLT